jgi:hypothetical protein
LNGSHIDTETAEPADERMAGLPLGRLVHA